MTVCPHCGRELEPSHTAEVSTCPECSSAHSDPSQHALNHPTRPTAGLPWSPGEGQPAATPSQPDTAGLLLKPRTPVPLTAVLVAINVLVFIGMVVKGASVMQPTPDQLLRWGANFGALTLTGQWWRLLSAMFVHIGIVHLAINMWCLWQLGLFAEHLFGRRIFVSLYFCCGLAASLASLIRNPLVISAGASGAIFGIAGALIATLYLAKLPARSNELRVSFISLVVFTIFNVGYALWTPPQWWPLSKSPIDNGAHIGGLISGLLLGAVLSQDFHAQERPRWGIRPMVFPAFAVLLVAGAVGVRYAHMPVVRLEDAEQRLRKGDNTGALRELNQIVKARPNYAPAWLLLGNAYFRTQQEAQAEAAWQRAVQLNPKNAAALAQLGVLYLREQRYEQARQQFQQIAELNPKDAEAQINLGVTLNLMGRTDEALANFRKATVLNPTQPLAWYNVGLASMNLKHYDDAVAAFQRTTKLAPRNAEAWIWLANAYQAKGKTEEADAAYLTGYKLRVHTQRAAPRRQ
jgi:rhomboid protease GluP